MARHLSDPAYRERVGKSISKVKRARMESDPEFAAKMREVGRDLGNSGLGHVAQSTPEFRERLGLAISEARMCWCPYEYRPYYHFLKRSKKFGADEARRLTLEKAEADRLAHLAATKAGDAIHFLRRYAPVLQREGGYLYGTAFLTPEQIVARAEAKGWQPERWAA